jgi:hypothetical protein
MDTVCSVRAACRRRTCCLGIQVGFIDFSASKTIVYAFCLILAAADASTSAWMATPATLFAIRVTLTRPT